MPPFPQALAYIWRAYLRMRGRKTMGFAGPAPLEWPDIDAFLRCSGLRLAPWELEIVELLDDRYLQAQIRTASAPDPSLVSSAPVEDPRAVRSILAGIGRHRFGNKKKGERSE